MNREDLKLYLVTDRGLLHKSHSLEEMVLEAVAGGVTMVQLREKNICTREFVELGMRLKSALAGSGVPLIVNDRVDVALAIDADGVHIGQSDMPYEIARKLLGDNKIIGLSVESLEQLEQANQLDVDYVGISPVFSTPTKIDTAPAFGIEGLRKAVSLSEHPTVAIGGINTFTAPDVLSCGVDGIAVVSAIVASPEPRSAACGLRQLLKM